MQTNSPNTRRWLRDLAAIGTVLAATMLVFDVAGLISVDALPPGTAAAPGMVLAPALGDSSTEMTLSLTSPDNVCPGDTATGNYRWNTFMAPASVDVGTLTYNNQGPISPAGVTVFPLFSAIGSSAQVNKATAVQTGQIVGTSTVSFAAFSPGNIAPGTYKIGYACTKVPALGQPAQTERFWQVQIAVTQSATGGPAQIAWTNGTPPTTTTTTTTVPAGGTTTRPRCRPVARRPRRRCRRAARRPRRCRRAARRPRRCPLVARRRRCPLVARPPRPRRPQRPPRRSQRRPPPPWRRRPPLWRRRPRRSHGRRPPRRRLGPPRPRRLRPPRRPRWWPRRERRPRRRRRRRPRRCRSTVA